MTEGTLARAGIRLQTLVLFAGVDSEEVLEFLGEMAIAIDALIGRHRLARESAFLVGRRATRRVGRGGMEELCHCYRWMQALEGAAAVESGCRLLVRRLLPPYLR